MECGRQQGIALLLALWALAVLMTIAASHAFSSRGEVVMTANLQTQAEARWLADAGARLGILELARTAVGRRDNNDHWRMDGSSYRIVIRGQPVAVSIEAEAGKVDLNAAPAALIIAVAEQLVAVEDRQALANAVREQRSALDHNRVLVSALELESVWGVPLTTGGLSQLFTVFSGDSKVDPMVASPAVLNAVPGLDKAVVEEFVARRVRELDVQTSNPAVVLTVAGKFVKLGGQSPIRPGASFTVRSEVRLASGGHAVREALVVLTDDTAEPYQLIGWRLASDRSAAPAHRCAKLPC